MSTSIEWADETWNPTVGCVKVSAGCEHCYAIRNAYRLEHAFKRSEYAGLTRRLPDGSLNWTGDVRVLPERLKIPVRWRSPRRVFVDSMSDLFHPDVPDWFLESVWQTMQHTPQHTYQVLSKRPQRVERWLRERAVLPNVWIGTSVEDQAAADARVPLLLDTRAAVRFLSCEPLLGPVELGVWALRLHWIIAGGESGPGYRPVNLEWVRSLRDQARVAGVAFFFKQHGGQTHAAGGCLLDGVEWKEFPDAA